MKISIDNTSPLITSEDTSVALCESLKKRGHDVKLHIGNEPFYTRIKTFPCDYYFTDGMIIDKDMIHFLSNNYIKTLFIINIPSQMQKEQVISLEKFLLENKVNYKFIQDSNFSQSSMSILKKKENLVNTCYGYTGYLLGAKDRKWDRKINTLFICNGQNTEPEDFFKIAEQGETFHILRTRNPYCQIGLENMRKRIEDYKDILCNYNSFCFWKLKEAPMGRMLYEICRLNKPVYVYEPSDIKYVHRALKTTEDLSWANRGNVNFDTIYKTVETEFTFEKQIDKLLSHLPKIK